MASYPVLEHRASRTSRWLRAYRFRIALGIAVVETILIAANVLQWRWAVLIAAAAFAFYVLVGRRSSRPAVRQVAWMVALSQAIPLLFPLFLGAITAVAIVIVAIFVLVVVAMLFFDRR